MDITIIYLYICYILINKVMTTVSKNIFTKLIENLKNNSLDHELENIAFSSEYRNYILTFANSTNENGLDIEEFCYKKNDKWIDCKPTKEQIKIMCKCIETREEELIQEEEEEDQEGESDLDDFFECGHYDYFGGFFKDCL